MRYKLLVYFVMLLLITAGLPAEETRAEKIRELEKQLDAAGDSEKTDVLVRLMEAHESKELEKVLQYGLESLKLLDRYPDDSLKIKVLPAISEAYHRLGEHNKALVSARKGAELAESAGNFHYQALCLLRAGSVYFETGRYKQAMSIYSEFLVKAEEKNDRYIVCRANQLIGNVYCQKAEYTRAMEYFNRAMTIADAMGREDVKAALYNSMGVVYAELNNMPQALFYYRKYHEAALKTGHPRGLNVANVNIGTVYLEMGELEKALEHGLKSLKIAREADLKLNAARAASFVGSVYLELGQTGRARRYLEQSLQTFRELDDRMYISLNLLYIAMTYRFQSNFSRAEHTCGLALKMAENIKAGRVIIRCLEEFTYIYAGAGDSAKFREYYRKYTDYRGESISENTGARVTQLRAQYEADKKEHEIELLKRENTISQLEASQQEQVKKVMAVGLFLLLGIVLLLYNRYRLKHKSQVEIQRKNEDLTVALKELEEANAEIKDLSGLLPICAGCKRIRDDGGYWHQVEVYIKKHSDADFSHSICPTCTESLYPGLEDGQQRAEPE